MLERKLAPPNAHLKELNPRSKCIYPNSLLLPQKNLQTGFSTLRESTDSGSVRADIFSG